ncbi:DotA/TraY family protein [Burkholderia stagnalis]|uniref:DotA/TraY family protein n=1 Tax=Burkholderia stagnalis TaxID=1503054 RepID=A0A6L3N365_9BURK|nr:DotA/TraY family protein [Burkholderia stagnalis]KAB0640713.1 DotA/TraY family protein [Burkholderia stagnalis]VWB06959.1 integral membrane protein [Burkholderia stagnalis]
MKKLFLFLLFTLASASSFAANVFEPSSGDISIKMLGAIFGGLLDSGGNDPLISGIKMFNGACLIIGGILAGYTILAGTLNTAHDGEMLGKKFSSVWVPVRYSVGTALVLPVVGGGYCVMQAIVMWLVVQGIGLADGVWSAFMSNPTSVANTNVQTYRDEIVGTAKAAFNASMCYRSYARAISESSSLLKFGQYNYTMTNTSQGWLYGDSTSSVRTNGCGEIDYPQDKNVTQVDSTVVNTAPTTNGGYLGDIGTIFAPMDVSAIRQAHNAQTDALVHKMDSLAASVIATAPKPGDDGVYGVSITPDQAKAYYAQIEQAADDYLKGVKGVADGLSTGDAYTKIQQAANNQGWILAGAWFTRIVQMNDIINKAVASSPTDESSAVGPAMDKLLFSDAVKYYDGAKLVLAADKRSQPGSFLGIKNSPDAENVAGSGVHITGNPLKTFQAGITSVLTGVNLYDLKNDTRHPLIVINELGNRLLTLAELVVGSIALVAVGTGALTGFITGGAQNGVIAIIGWFLDVPIKVLTGAGAGAAFFLPNMPFIIWIGCIVGWVLLVIEAIIAAPLWAIMHLHPNGDDMTGRAGNGYSLVLSLLLRPVLMIFGMEAAIIISSVVGELINKAFFEVFAQSTNSTTGISALFSLAIGSIVYLAVMFIFIRKCFSIVHQLPDQMLQWIGGPTGAQLGQFAGDFSKAADKAGGAASGAIGFGTGAANVAAKTGLQALARKSQRNANEEKHKLANIDRQMNERYGDGTADMKNSHASMLPGDSFSSVKKAIANSQAYDRGLDMATVSDPINGKADFDMEFSRSEENGHKDFGGSAVNAAHSIGQQIMDKSLEGNPNGGFIKAYAGNNTKNLRNIMKTIGNMESNIGSDATKQILDKALSSGDTGKELHNRAEALYQEEKQRREDIKKKPDDDGGKVPE